MSTMTQLAPAGEISHQAAIRDLATSVLSLLRTATSEVERDRQAAKTFIARGLFAAADRGRPPRLAQPGGAIERRSRSISAPLSTTRKDRVDAGRLGLLEK
jgi:hypothetical protein